MNVLVIPEDFRKDQYLLKPIVTAMIARAADRKAKVRVCQDPLLGGIGEALKWERIEAICRRYKGMVDLFLLVVDRDGVVGRRAALDDMEARAQGILGPGRSLLAENAWQEIEVWVLAGHELPNAWDWREIRAERDPKERYFLPLAAQRNLLDEPGQGRVTLAQEAAGNYPRIRKLCPEDVALLERRIRAIFATRRRRRTP